MVVGFPSKERNEAERRLMELDEAGILTALKHAGITNISRLAKAA